MHSIIDAFLRILASNQTIYRGRDNHAEATDHVLLIGKCMMEYGYNHALRSMAEFRERGIQTNIEDLVCLIRGHDVTLEQVEEAYQKLRAHYEKEQAEKAEAALPAGEG